ncbi:carboxypeptidase-like regulatory domain-containing protein [Arthrobacter sp. RT-1]|uniref:carboxypeptidase-like regulatory domain-containing protein n=1 Tax=Arthrobacter sp. RT-1 TaxID=2292263 RepID=UPI0037BF7504
MAACAAVASAIWLLQACSPPPATKDDLVTPPLIISGVVWNTPGMPVANARVYFVEGPGSLPDIAALSGSDGKFTLTAPEPGQYTIGCTADDYLPTQISVSVPPAAAIEFRLEAPS